MTAADTQAAPKSEDTLLVSLLLGPTAFLGFQDAAD